MGEAMESTFNRYEVFLKVAELGNITRAAEALNYTQSGVSHSIAALEREAGFPLFLRGSGGVALTERGRRLLAPVQELVNRQRNLAQAIHEINDVVCGTLRLGTFTSVSAQWLPWIIRDFQRSCPGVEFDLRAGDYDEIGDWIRREKIDCGFLSAPVPEGLSFRPLKEDPMKVILPVGHPLAERGSLTLPEIAQEPFIIPMKGSDNDIQALLRRSGVSVRVRYALNDEFSVMSMVEHGFGVSIMPELILRNFRFSLLSRDLSPEAHRTLGIASLPSERVSVVGRTFIRYLSGPAVDLLRL